MRLPSLPGAAVDFGEAGLRRFLDVEGTLQATVLAAQAFTSLIRSWSSPPRSARATTCPIGSSTSPL